MADGRQDKAPEGWEETTKKLKKHPEIDNPWALSWWMANQGYTPGGKGKESKGDAADVVERLDISRLGRVERTPQGGARIPANLTRVGVLNYTQPDGTIRRELRLPAEVFAKDSLDSLRDAPVVEGHPAMVNPTNWGDLAVGHVPEAKPADTFVASKIVVQRDAALQKIDSGELQELSCGYTCKFDPTPGEWCGQAYDGIQREIRYNHVGLGPRGWGRAGSDVGLRLDGGHATTYYDGHEMTTEEEMAAEKIEEKLDSLTRELGATQVRLDGMTKERDTQAARADAAEAQVKTLQTKLDEVNDTKRLDELVNKRVSVVTAALKVLGSGNFDGKTDREVMAEVVGKAYPEIKCDSKSDDYVMALFDRAVATGYRADGIQGFSSALQSVQRSDAADDADDKEDQEYEVKRQARSKKPLQFSKDGK